MSGNDIAGAAFQSTELLTLGHDYHLVRSFWSTCLDHYTVVLCMTEACPHPVASLTLVMFDWCMFSLAAARVSLLICGLCGMKC